ncbi:uncharacterized protein LOC106779847 [Vigna radiata var. radiata]|uniref:Uncharacterized protein LOC106779847 n=1 Tax=Vigna radiata var. radiata TaxID=3916 RepID=A0A1S3VYZ0_VIGRR|nr:uncharacterized protein LOC106779847 [Vigna radiata var. radiata]
MTLRSHSVLVSLLGKLERPNKLLLDSLVGDGERQYARLYDYVGQLLRVKYVGPNDQYFPLAFALVENECKESWRWFSTLLLDDIGGTDCQCWVFISNQQKGLMTVFDDILDGVEHRLCLRHLYNNYKKIFGGGVLIRDLMMGAAKATFQKDCEMKMGELKTVNIDAYNWLLARDKPIITMMEWIRTYIMRRFATLREKAMTYPGVVMPRPRKRLDKEVEKSGNWIPTWAGAAKFEVTHGFTMDKFVVDLSNHSCRCYSWELIGIPCRHAIVSINYKVENPEEYVHPYYKKEAYVACYGPEIVPINGQQMWSTSENTPLLLPPIYKTPHGRPKKLKRREADEYVSHTKLSKKHDIMKCSSCNEFGHNNTRGTSSATGSGSRTRSEAEAPPSTSQEGGTSRRGTSQLGGPPTTT